MKKIQIIQIVFTVILWGCRKEKLPEPAPAICTERCDYASNLVNHHWIQVGDYWDSTSYALNNIGLMPLPTSGILSIDSCRLDDEQIFNLDGTSYGLAHSKCDPSQDDTLRPPEWKISSDRKSITFGNVTTLEIESITPSYMKLYHYFDFSVSGASSKKTVRLLLYKSI